ncbi:MAG: hypothetical protein OEU26_02535 [Candidatus Tectomicrobia bacterium]|nr:hypothetical protein [Candidatus Tectomicrobia bacterium]
MTSDVSRLQLASTIVDEPIEPVLFARMKAAFERHGGRIIQSAEIDRYLQVRGAEGITDNAKQILLPTRPSGAAVFEEFIHTAQHRTGRFTRLVEQVGNVEAERLLEMEAAAKLIRNRKAWGVANAATRATIAPLRRLSSQGGGAI